MLGFPGQTRTLADLYYNRYRDYDSSLGRYIQADPIGLGGGNNPYLYAEANPLSLIDPMGLNPVVVEGVIAVGEGIGEGFVWWCRSNIALCARTVGPPIVRMATACNALIKSLTGDDDVRKSCHQKCVDETVGRGFGSDAPLRYRKCMRKCLSDNGITDY